MLTAKAINDNEVELGICMMVNGDPWCCRMLVKKRARIRLATTDYIYYHLARMCRSGRDLLRSLNDEHSASSHPAQGRR